ncbi:hydrogenase maturation protease [Corynebacterium sp. 153RC1]|uniref:hydrogenase maturation protease n=1 Tax=unclassified Corynebacterium TaxID=2624378 RepID=UPI00211C7E71|nr:MULTISPECIES: hydrogenase maturation protease [unclassified Corynebacterium]MCQ9370712.1 hydrogenase maturation protease [Corynebacterium sp. 35RC1]MCQ9352644.1 hydrogenase maturation protease [Corynebacterium sp. 209RC1]MCQ9354828.1 hydrogenase maturation protease [Corynebacterium sp. 1222RC1]MCQ9357013.1 hydrogenase maturation protease [Corynebacterium sp. 122RC1]MCQ9359096.1 hydrogenase maturation protease [Corynebacterium sp. 142RC1]
MSARIHVIGIGNPIMADDAAGLAILQRLQARYGDQGEPGRARACAGSGGGASAGGGDGVAVGMTLEFIDGGTSGMEILPDIQDATKLLVLDAITHPVHPPGTVLTYVGDQLPRLRKQAVSPHQVGLLDLLSTARLLGSEPQEVVVVGIVARSAELHVGLSPEVEASVPLAVEKAKEVLDAWLGLCGGESASSGC